MAKYRCPLCGWVYDEEAEGAPFSTLERCPMCGAAASEFYRVEDDGVTPAPDAPQEAAPEVAPADAASDDSLAVASRASPERSHDSPHGHHTRRSPSTAGLPMARWPLRCPSPNGRTSWCSERSSIPCLCKRRPCLHLGDHPAPTRRARLRSRARRSCRTCRSAPCRARPRSPWHAVLRRRARRCARVRAASCPKSSRRQAAATSSSSRRCATR